MKLETQFVVLLVLSAAALALQTFHPRTIAIDGDAFEWIATPTSDSPDEITSHSHVNVEHGVINVDLDVADFHEDDHAGVMLKPKRGGQSFDFSWMKSIQLVARVEGIDKAFVRVQVGSWMPNLFDDTNEAVYKHNETAIIVTDQTQTITLGKENFHVPTWWMELHEASPGESLTSFDQVQWINFLAGSQTSSSRLRLVIEEVRVVGHWISPARLYRTLLVLWFILGIGVVVQKTMVIRESFSIARAKEEKLAQLNKNLSDHAKKLSTIARYDALTGLLNRHGLRDYVSSAQAMMDAQEANVSIVIFDIDFFKKINDTHGHSFADNILEGVGEMLTMMNNGNEAVARWGGEEFLSICSDCDWRQASQYAERIRESVTEKLGITCSFGVHQWSRSESFSDAIELVDKALYKAKNSGRNRVVVTEKSKRLDLLMTR